MQDELDKQLDLPKDTIEGKARDHEIIGTKQNMFCSDHKTNYGDYSENYQNMRWMLERGRINQNGILVNITEADDLDI